MKRCADCNTYICVDCTSQDNFYICVECDEAMCYNCYYYSDNKSEEPQCKQCLVN